MRFCSLDTPFARGCCIARSARVSWCVSIYAFEHLRDVIWYFLMHCRLLQVLMSSWVCFVLGGYFGVLPALQCV